MFKIAIAALLLIFTSSALAYVDISDSNRMANVLESNLGELKYVFSECAFSIEADVVCTKDTAKTGTCTANGMNNDSLEFITKTFDATNLIASLKASGITFSKSVDLKGLRCTVTKAGFAGCSGDLKVDDILCAAESVEKKQ